MQTEENNQKILEEQTKQVYDLYKAKSKNFRVFFMWLVGFSLLFFGIILYPYVLMQVKNHEISLAKKEILEDLKCWRIARKAGVQRTASPIGEGSQTNISYLVSRILYLALRDIFRPSLFSPMHHVEGQCHQLK